MDLISNSKDSDLPIFRAHVERTLKDRIKKIDKAQKKAMRTFSSDIWNDRSFYSDDIKLVYSHRPQHRFVDMKVRNKKPKKNYQVHNRILMGQFSGIMGDLTYGLTESVKDDLRKKILKT